MPSPDDIARACLAICDSLPRRGKPQVRSNGQPEWTVLAGFVLVNETSNSNHVVSLGTGVKCLPANRLPPHGDVLHDSHAEIIARRGFLLWLYNEIALYEEAPSDFLQRSDSCPDLLELKPEYTLHVYVSTLPCGDASTVHLSRTQDPEIAATFENVDLAVISAGLARGRQGFLHLGALRTKPARADAISTESLSCSDKLASYTYLGVQGALLSKLIRQIYVNGYVFGGVAVDLRPEIAEECDRALYGRVSSLPACGQFRLHRPTISFTDVAFVHAKESIVRPPQIVSAPASESISWICGQPVEVLLSGIKQGHAVAKGGPQKTNARSRLCRLALFACFVDRSGVSGANLTYGHSKQTSEEYQEAKRFLRCREDSPFREWPVSSRALQDFDVFGLRKSPDL